MRNENSKKTMAATLFAAFALPALATFDLGEHFAKPEAWEESAVDFTVNHKSDRFVFASQKRDIVNCLARGATSWHGIEVWEAKVYYAENRPSRVELSLYNQGDDKSGSGMDLAALESLMKTIGEKVEPGSKTLPMAKKTEVKGGYRHVRNWVKADPGVELTWGIRGKGKKDATVAYVRAVLTPKGKDAPKGATKSVSGIVSKAKVKANVRKESDGDVWVANIPMVDQGQKGYCAVAVSERVLRYFGYPIDEHEMAQVAGSSAQGGTSIDSMKETVRTVGSKCRLGYNEIVSMMGSFKNIEKDLDQYNKAAKAAKEPQLSMSQFTRGNTVMVGEMYAAMKPMVIKQMRLKDSRFKKFIEGIRKQVDQGNPVFWGVTLGMYPEPEIPQASGGHMRLIIGYNKATKEIIYSDTWGAGHEKKKMPEDWAFAITHDAFFLRPL